METRDHSHREAWNKGKLVGQKAPLKPKDIWAIRIHLQNAHEVRDLAMFNLAIDSKLRGCDLVSLRVRDVTHGNLVLSRAMVVQRKTQRPVQFELTEPTRTAGVCADREGGLEGGAFPLPEPFARLPPCFHSAVREDRRALGGSGRPRSFSLRHALYTANEGNIDLQAHEEPEGRSALAGSLKAGVDSAVPGYRGR